MELKVMDMEEQETITLYDENGQETDFEVLGVVSAEENDYAILIPLEEEEDEEGNAYIFRIDTQENGEELLTEVENDEEFQRVKEAWEAICEGDFDLAEDDTEYYDEKE
jgi:uncharacterized protein YrzB (UPF0473 family)